MYSRRINMAPYTVSAKMELWSAFVWPKCVGSSGKHGVVCSNYDWLVMGMLW